MSTVAKADAIAALRSCGGDVSHVGLRRAGVPARQTTAVGRILDDLGCTVKSGHGNLRQLVVPIEAAIAAIAALDGDVIELPDDGDRERRRAFAVTHDPHEIYCRGEAISLPYLRYLVAQSVVPHEEIDGLEVHDGELTYRIYRGRLYRLEDGEMIEVQI